MINRKIENKILQALNNFRIVYINGARQTGKTTFVKQIAIKKNYNYVTFDDEEKLQLAKNNPNLFFATNKPPIIIDEVQKVPHIINKIKTFVDNKPDKKGQFILTGSVDFLKSAKINESLAGRMVNYELYPFSFTELNDINYNLVEILFNPDFYKYFENVKNQNHNKILNRLLVGGFPEIQTIDVSIHKQWFSNYFKARISKDINSLTENNLRKANKIPELLKLLAMQSANLLNISNLTNKLKLSFDTVGNYIFLLEAMFLIERLKPYEKNIGKQVKKMNKLYFTDTGFISSLLKITKDKLLTDRQLFGQLLENYIYNEMKKHISFSNKDFEMFYYRDNKTYEVDFIIENNNGEIICVEVKSAQNITKNELKGLRSFKRNFEKIITSMYVFYGGEEISAMNIDNFPVYLLPYKYFF